ncbi:MAG: hypothetical protein KBD50_02030 [Candidatus Pacebacteria bacterium]|nr:hypothetical protein [Candidatus Paceibacterota bacterium]
MSIDTVTENGLVNTVRVNHFDNHLHGRRHPLKKFLLGQAAERMNGGVLEPNTNPHILTCDDAKREVDEAREIAPHRHWFASIYLTPTTEPKEVLRAWEKGLILHVKWYPPHGSTHSEESVQPEDLLDKNSSTGKLLSMMAEAGIPLKNHGEVAHWKADDVDAYDRERIYYSYIQPHIPDLYPNLKQILAHISTEEAVDYAVGNGDPEKRIFEVTAHHLAFDRRILYDGGFLLPDHHCLPVVKAKRHLFALQRLLQERPSYVVAGSDMAAHPTTNKYAARAFGGYYTYHCALELYVQSLDQLGLLDYAQAFLYGNAQRFHGARVPVSAEPFTLTRQEWTINGRYEFAGQQLTPFGFDENEGKRFKFQWMLVEQ